MLSLDDYLASLARFVDDAYGRRMRSQFQTRDGKSELAMLAAPTRDEYEQCRRLAAIMTADEKQNAERLSDEQAAQLAQEAGVDPAVAAIFLNGYALQKSKEKR
jgi:hypothetical protein